LKIAVLTTAAVVADIVVGTAVLMDNFADSVLAGSNVLDTRHLADCCQSFVGEVIGILDDGQD